MIDKKKISQLENDLSELLKEFTAFKKEMAVKVSALESENIALKERLKKHETPKNSTKGFSKIKDTHI